MSNVIMLWKGTVASIPSGCYLCDGNNGTPNLLDYFIVCAGGGYTQGTSGGSNTRSFGTHTHTIGSHTHSVTSVTVSNTTNNTMCANASGYDYSVAAGGHNHSYTPGTIGSNTATASADAGQGPFNNRPVYYALAYIMLNVDWCQSGVIALAIGASAPTGWAICDGTNSTPNLAGKFIVAAGTSYSLGATGGNASSGPTSHTHTSAHTHPISGSLTSPSGTQTVSNISNQSVATTSHTHTLGGTSASGGPTTGLGNATAVAHLPIYKAYYYIQKT
jgi:hypothetical protein